MIPIIKEYISHLNQNNLFLGLSIIMMNIGSRYIQLELSNTHKKFLSSKLGQFLLLFIIVFTATRDIVMSFIVTTIFIVLVLNLFNENSKYYILPKSFTDLDTDKDGEVSPEEIKQAYLRLKAEGKIS
jgi:hypothetical protein